MYTPGCWKFQKHMMSAKESHSQQVEPSQDGGHVGYKQKGHQSSAAQPWRVHMVTPRAPEAGHEAIGFGVCLGGIQSCFVQSFLAILLFFPLGEK
jgi:hypothetical protein